MTPSDESEFRPDTPAGESETLLYFFAPDAPLGVAYRKLPHWSQQGVASFITWRTADSIPSAVLEAWCTDRDNWLREQGIDPATDQEWKLKLQELPPQEIRFFHAHFTTRWHEALDECHGACVLRRPALAGIVEDSLRHFDGDRYRLHQFVVMPNHVHLLVSFFPGTSMLAQCESWKRYTAAEINKVTGGKGRFWQSDAFDHLVRNEHQWNRLKRYITENPAMAKLKPGEFRLG